MIIVFISSPGQRDFAGVDFDTSEGNGFVKLLPMIGWVHSTAPFVVHVDCEHFESLGVDDIGIDESRLTAVRYGTLHVPPEPPGD